MNPKLKFHKTKIATAITLSSLIAQTPQIAVAQEQTLEEIIVTATRRDMVPSEIPFNISAITGDEIEEAHVTDMEGLMRAMPGITVADGGGRFSENNNVITIRGLNVDHLRLIDDF